MSRKCQNSRPGLAINNLPDELLLRVILQTIYYDNYPHEWFPCRLPHYKSRGIIMGVCRKWHQLVEGSPELWTSFTISNRWGNQSDENTLMPKSKFIALWQTRSWNWSLDIHLYTRSFTAHSEDGITMLSALLPSIDKWHQVDLALDQKAAEAFILYNHPTAGGPGSLEIRASTFCEKAETNDQLLVAFGHWPNLAKLMWIYAAGYLTTSRPTFHNVLHLFPWRKLRHISLEVSWTMIQFHSFFNSATSAQLIRLNMRQHPTDLSPPLYPHSVIRLSELR